MTVQRIGDDALRQRAIQILIRELGIVDSTRFLSLVNPPKRGADYVKWRHKWLASIDQEAWVADILEKMSMPSVWKIEP